MGQAQKAPRRPTNATVTPVASSTDSVELLAANSDRKGAVIFNGVTRGILYVKLGAGASAASHTVALLPKNSFSLDHPAYTGQVSGVWSQAGVGNAQITELT